MKILYHHRIASKDGQYVHIIEIINSLVQLGHEVVIVGPRVVELNPFGFDGGFISKLKKFLPSVVYEFLEFSYSLVAFIKLVSAVLKYRPDCLYERYNLFLPAGIWIKKIFNLPMLLEVNAPLFCERLKYNGVTLKGLAKWSENYTWSNADYVLPVTKVLANIIQKQANIPEGRIKVIPNGINPEKFSNAPSTEQAKIQLGLEGRFILGFTGFVREWHRLDLVLDLLSDIDAVGNMHLLIVGDGPAKESLVEKAKNLGLQKKLTVTGVVNRKNIDKYIAAFDVALQPDVVDYASPLKLFEYLVLGKPIVAPPKDNIREILTDGKNCVLVSFTDKRLKTFIRLLRDDEEIRKSFSEEAFKTIATKKLTWRNNAHVIIELFHNLLDRQHYNEN